MPSILLDGRSGGVQVLSGVNLYFSGFPGFPVPTGGTLFTLAPNASGNAYLAFGSGLVTVNSGGAGNVSGGIRDGMVMAPGISYFAPRTLIDMYSGSPQLWVTVDAAASGQARLYFQPDLQRT